MQVRADARLLGQRVEQRVAHVDHLDRRQAHALDALAPPRPRASDRPARARAPDRGSRPPRSRSSPSRAGPARRAGAPRRSTALAGRERAPPRTLGMMQYEQWQSQPSCTFTKPRVRVADSGRRASTSVSTSTQPGPAVPATSSATSSAVPTSAVTSRRDLVELRRVQVRGAPGHDARAVPRGRAPSGAPTGATSPPPRA